MTWFSASLIYTFVLRNKSDTQDLFPVFEDFVLIEAASAAEAERRATEIGETDARANDDLMFNGKASEKVFMGVRKLRSVYNPPPLDIDADRPISGTEISHSFYEVHSLDDVMKISRGKRVTVKYIDDDTE